MTVATLILGLGNPLRSDDGVGIQVLEALKAESLPAGVEAMDGGTEGLGLVNLMSGWSRVIVIDAADMGRLPGDVQRFDLEQARLPGAQSHLSVHGAGLGEALLLARALGSLPDEVILYGVQPATLDWSEGLSPQVAAAVPDLVAAIMDEVSGTD